MNSLLENRNKGSYAFDLIPCDICESLTAWTRCVSCGGQFELHSKWAQAQK